MRFFVYLLSWQGRSHKLNRDLELGSVFVFYPTNQKSAASIASPPSTLPVQASKNTYTTAWMMERCALLRSLSCAAFGRRLLESTFGSTAIISTAIKQNPQSRFPNHPFHILKRAFSLLPLSVVTISPSCATSAIDCIPSTAIGIRNRRLFSADASQLPVITDPDVQRAFKDLMAASWDEIPEGAIHSVKEALSKTTEDKAGQEALVNVFRAAEAVEHFAGVLVSLKMELDDSIGLSGEKSGYLANNLDDALRAAYKRYKVYLDAFGPDETYLRKKVEVELGAKMIHLKMRCSGLEPEWGKITVLGTSGLSGSYVEQRAS